MKDRRGRRFTYGDRVIVWTARGPASGTAVRPVKGYEHLLWVAFDHGVQMDDSQGIQGLVLV